MPGLTSRIGADSIQSFEAAARNRFEEASLLYYGMRRYAAVYLYGYAIEMWVKAAYFHNEGLIRSVTAPITDVDRNRAWHQRAAARAPTRVRTNQHDFEQWAYLLTYVRSAAGLHPPYDPLLRSTIEYYAGVAREHWDVEMRYKHVDVLDREIEEVREVAEWFRANYPSL